VRTPPGLPALPSRTSRAARFLSVRNHPIAGIMDLVSPQRICRRDQDGNILPCVAEVVLTTSIAWSIALRSSGSSLGYEPVEDQHGGHGEQAAMVSRPGHAPGQEFDLSRTPLIDVFY